jgi:hypothetical protein
MTTLAPEDLAALTALDTPTVCNALERLDPATQARGFTTQPFLCGFPQIKSIVGYARTATIRSMKPSGLTPAAQRALQNDYYRHIDAGPRPSIAVIEDLDGEAAGYGAFWGEVQSAIHVGLGAVSPTGRFAISINGRRVSSSLRDASRRRTPMRNPSGWA